MRLIAATHPFRVATTDMIVPDGLTLAEMVERVQADPILLAHGHLWIDDQYIPRDRWRLVRPKPGVTVTLRVVPHGGGGGGGKNPLRTVLTIAVIAASFYFGPIVGGMIGGISSTAANTTMVFGSLSYAALGGAIVAVAGTLLVNAIAPIRPAKMGELTGTAQRDSPTLFIEGARNTARPFGAVPVVLGVHKHVPPLGAQSYTEIVGDAQYLRVLVVWGYGPLKIENIKIGETPIANFDGVQIETKEGRTTDTPRTLIPDTVVQENYSILLTQAADWQVRSAPVNADELSIDITFGNGLVQFDANGQRASRSVTAQIEYREIGGSPLAPWSTPVFTATTVDASWISGNTVTFTHNRTAAIRHGFRWAVPTRGDYEIRVRRTSADTDNTQIFDQFGWTAIRTFRNEDPIAFPFPLATTELVIKATDQLNSAVDELNATVSSYVDSYAGSPAWSEAVSSNPADLMRHVLQGNANARRLTDARVDIDKIEEWHTFCVNHGFEFNQIRDYQASVWDTLADIAAAGRASPAQVDGKWTVVYDDEQSVPVQHFTPRNSWGFEAEKAFPDQPHALRSRFANRNKEWRQDELIVYADGYTAANATDFEGLDWIGITDPDHVWKQDRFHLAQAKLRPERWTFNTDFEYLVARRGDLVLVTHDVLLVGLASGRIKSLTYDGSSPPNITGFVSDETLTMEAGTDYGVSIRSTDNTERTAQIVTSAGAQTTVTFSTPMAPGSAPAAGDLFGFGPLGQETIEGLLLSIEPQSELSARVVCIPASPAVYQADTGAIPEFDSKLTPVAGVPVAVVTGVRSDESVLQLGSGNTLVPHIGLSVQAVTDPLVSLDVQIRAMSTGEPFYPAAVTSVTGGEYLIGNVSQGSGYDLRVRWRDPARLPGVWTYAYGHRVVGQSNPPSALSGATISVFGGSALIRWDQPNELDVRFGGTVQFRHSPETDPNAAVWQSSTSIGTAAKGDSLFAQLPLKPGTYLARVYDKGGRPSDVVALATKQASVLAFATVDTITESPTFTGTHDNTVVSDGTLKIAGLGLFDDIPDVDALPDLDSFGGIAAFGTYGFAAGFDFTTITRVRLTSLIDATSVNILDRIDDRAELIDSWEDFDGTTQSAADCRVQVATTDDDPNGSPVAWSVWNNLDSGEFECRGCKFRALLTTNDVAYNIRVDALGVVAEEI